MIPRLLLTQRSPERHRPPQPLRCAPDDGTRAYEGSGECSIVCVNHALRVRHFPRSSSNRATRRLLRLISSSHTLARRQRSVWPTRQQRWRRPSLSVSKRRWVLVCLTLSHTAGAARRGDPSPTTLTPTLPLQVATVTGDNGAALEEANREKEAAVLELNTFKIKADGIKEASASTPLHSPSLTQPLRHCLSCPIDSPHTMRTLLFTLHCHKHSRAPTLGWLRMILKSHTLSHSPFAHTDAPSLAPFPLSGSGDGPDAQQAEREDCGAARGGARRSQRPHQQLGGGDGGVQGNARSGAR